MAHKNSAGLPDASPVGHVTEITGQASVTHADGVTETITNGTAIYQSDIIETDATGAVNISFIDDTSFAVSEGARLVIDEYIYDPQTQSGETNFSVLKGVFVFTSGLIGRDDPDDVKIETPAGSIGIRGTIIAGNVDSGEITVVEGAIVLTDHSGHEMTLATQFETARFHNGEGIENIGQLTAKDIGEKFFVVSQVSPTLFSSINDAAAEEGTNQPPSDQEPVTDTSPKDVAPADSDDHSDIPSDDTHTTAALPPVPAPVSNFETTGFDTAQSGLNMHAPTTTLANFLTADVAAIGAATSTASTMPAMPSNTYNHSGETPAPTTTTPPIAAASNASPVFLGEAPQQFFHSSEGQSWHYRFDNEFIDDGGSSNLTYKLSDATTSNLNALMAGGSAGSDLLLAAGWTFNATTGDLVMNFNSSFSGSAPVINNFTISVQAVDNAGASSAYHDYIFSAHNASLTTMPATLTAGNKIVSSTTGVSAQIASGNNDVFLSGANDTIVVNSGTGNEVYMGNGRNTLSFQTAARDNIGVGGDGHDVFNMKNTALKLYGMSGDDDFVMTLDGGSTVITDMQSNLGSIMDGGHSNFRAGLVLNANGVNTVKGEAGGRGDSLVLDGTGSLNFSNVNSTNKIYSIERIDSAESTDAQTMILNYNDVLRMTDDKNTLIINIDDGDHLDLTGMSGMVKVLDNVNIDDAANGDAANMRSYDVFTDGTVTLLISATGAAAANGVTMDGTAVAI